MDFLLESIVCLLVYEVRLLAKITPPCLSFISSTNLSVFVHETTETLISFFRLQILLRWILEEGASALPKSYNATRLAQNFAIFDFQLTEADHEKIAKIPAFRACPGDFMVEELNGPYKSHEELWDTREGLVAE